MLGEGDTFGINGSFGAIEKKFSINFSKTKTKFFLSFHYNGDNSYLFVKGKKIYKNVNFPNQLYLESISNKLIEAEELSLKGNMYDFSVDYHAID